VMDEPRGAVVAEIRVAPEPSYAQRAAWVRLWRILLGPDHHSPAPAAPDAEVMDEAIGP
jgi:hypothetical protein